MPKRLISTFRRFQLSFWIGFAIVGFLISSAAILWLLGAASVSKARSVRSEFVDRDLRELVSRFDSDERYVLEHNIDALVPETRVLMPLLLPRQYYVGLPPNHLRAVPRQPPRNCFVELIPIGSATVKHSAAADKICLYFSENGAVGRYLFLAADIYDEVIVPLRKGDVTLTADALRITVMHAGHRVNWWLTLQSPREQSIRSRFEINAFRENFDGTRERDKRVEGWAYAQKQVDGSQVLRIMARIDFYEFVSEPAFAPISEHWPPKDWQDVRLHVFRKDVSSLSKPVRFVPFEPKGRSQLSLVSLADSIFDSYSELAVRHSLASGSTETESIQPAAGRSREWNALHSYLRMINGDLVIAANKVTRARILPDTNIIFLVTHPGVIIEQVVWQSFLALFMMFLIGLIFAWYFYRNLLKPIFTLTRSIRYLVSAPPGDDHELPYSSQANELGTLARGFNELLAETRRRAHFEAEEERRRQAVEEGRRKEAIQVREENLKLIGHEVRSPLQALISLHEPGSKSRPFLDRIHKALEYLQGTLSAQQAVSERELDLKEVDIALFLNLVSSQAPLAGILNVQYSGPEQGVYCRIDSESIEDSIENVLKNANRFRTPKTAIELCLSHDEKYATISILNQGPNVAEEHIGHIFEYGMSTTPKQNGSGEGIGLYVAKQYLLLMHATIAVRNVAGGVCFDIKIPLFHRRKSGGEISFATAGRKERRGTDISIP
jgi:signal transduction histidine kinase